MLYLCLVPGRWFTYMDTLAKTSQLNWNQFDGTHNTSHCWRLNLHLISSPQWLGGVAWTAAGKMQPSDMSDFCFSAIAVPQLLYTLLEASKCFCCRKSISSSVFQNVTWPISRMDTFPTIVHLIATLLCTSLWLLMGASPVCIQGGVCKQKWQNRNMIGGALALPLPPPLCASALNYAWACHAQWYPLHSPIDQMDISLNHGAECFIRLMAAKCVHIAGETNTCHRVMPTCHVVADSHGSGWSQSATVTLASTNLCITVKRFRLL